MVEREDNILLGQAVLKNYRRFLVFSIIRRIVGLIALVLCVIGIVSEKRYLWNIMLAVEGIVCVLEFLAQPSDKGRTCVHCGTKLRHKQILALPEDDFRCPHCGQQFQAKVSAGELNL